MVVVIYVITKKNSITKSVIGTSISVISGANARQVISTKVGGGGVLISPPPNPTVQYYYLVPLPLTSTRYLPCHHTRCLRGGKGHLP